ASDRYGNVYVADQGNSTIRKITRQGLVSTVAGSPQQSGSVDGLGSAARFSYPADVAVAESGNLYVGDRNNSTIRKITPAGRVSTLAGVAGNDAHVDGSLDVARFMYPTGIALGEPGLIYVADGSNDTIRLLRLPDNSAPTSGHNYPSKGSKGATK